MEVIRSSETSVLTRATLRDIPEVCILQLLVTANFFSISLFLVTLMMVAILAPKSLFLQKLHGISSQKTTFLIVTAVKTSNLT
jgi:hypothetical protein